MKRYLLIIFVGILNLVYAEEDLIYFSFQDLRNYNTIILIIDPETGTILEKSKGAEEFYGYPKLVGMKISEINTLSEEDVKKEMQNAKNEKRNFFRFKHRLANGKIREVEVNSYPMKYKNRDVLMSRIRDVTEENNRKKILYISYFLIIFIILLALVIILGLLLKIIKNEKEIEEEKRFLDKTEEMAKIGGWEFDLLRNKLKWSKGTYKIHEISEKEYTPTVESAINFYDEKSKPIIIESVKNLIENEKEYDVELQLITAKNNHIHVRTKGEVLKNKKGQNIKIYGTIQDITEIKNIQDNLIKAKEEAERLNRVKSEFIANISHEIRTPMNSIIGFLDILLNIETSKEKKEYLEIINQSSLHLMEIINDILNISKIEANKFQIKKINLNILKIADDLAKIYKKEFMKKKINFIIEMDNKLNKNILVDKKSILIVLNNLLSNALKFTEKGYVKLSLIDDNGNIIIKVKDTGIGINKDKQSKIFEPFEQGENFLNKKYGGTGLGLAIVKNIVDMLNGEIEFTSIENEGTEFIVDIPYEEGEIVNIADDNIKNVEIKKQNPEQKIKILSVEDSEVNQKLIELIIITSKNMIVKKVYNGKEAIEELQKNKYDVILMDVQMPTMDGIEATKIIRKMEKYKDIPIIALSAHAFEDEIKNIFDAGVDDYVSKPFNKEILIEKIYSVLDKVKK
ncbi:MAG TPA: response regulator [Spirochaetota bacterium]|nr:response regulator [Spirochaetota bacterium]HOL57662.1 response regulator [Spirochaetota bacterium]HPP05231.1 response regulator [Spirochaetota bacterium]